MREVFILQRKRQEEKGRFLIVYSANLLILYHSIKSIRIIILRLSWRTFIKGFNASFKSNKNNTQAISTTSEQYRGFDSKDYIFWGVFKEELRV